MRVNKRISILQYIELLLLPGPAFGINQVFFMISCIRGTMKDYQWALFMRSHPTNILQWHMHMCPQIWRQLFIFKSQRTRHKKNCRLMYKVLASQINIQNDACITCKLLIATSLAHPGTTGSHTSIQCNIVEGTLNNMQLTHVISKIGQ